MHSYSLYGIHLIRARKAQTLLNWRTFASSYFRQERSLAELKGRKCWQRI